MLRSTKSRPLMSKEEDIEKLYNERINKYLSSADIIHDAKKNSYIDAKRIEREFIYENTDY